MGKMLFSIFFETSVSIRSLFLVKIFPLINIPLLSSPLLLSSSLFYVCTVIPKKGVSSSPYSCTQDHKVAFQVAASSVLNFCVGSFILSPLL